MSFATPIPARSLDGGEGMAAVVVAARRLLGEHLHSILGGI